MSEGRVTTNHTPVMHLRASKHCVLLICSFFFAQVIITFGQQLSVPAVEWQGVYGGGENDLLNVLRQTADGGFIAGGTSYSPADGNKTAPHYAPPEYWVVRLDAHGDVLWDRSFDGVQEDSLSDVRETADGGFILGGTSVSGIGVDKTAPYFGGIGDYWIIRLDTEGNEVWQQSLGGSREDFLQRILQTTDGGFLAAGWSYSPPSGNKTTALLGDSGDFWVVRLDADGNKLWEASYGGIDDDLLWTAERCRDGGFALGGRSDSPPGGNKTSPHFGTTNRFYAEPDFWIVRLDSNGNKLWDQSYGGTNDDTMYAIVELPDGGFALGGRSKSPPGGNKTSPNYGRYDYWLIRTDANGNKVWEQTFGGNEDDFLYSLGATTDGGFILGGYSHSEVSGTKTAPKRGSSDYWIIRLDADGHKLWEETFGGSRSDGFEGQSVQQTSDGGFIVGGSSYSPADGNKTVRPWSSLWCDFWLVKLAPEQPQLRLSPAGDGTNGWRLTLHGIKNLSYAVEYSSDFQGWKTLATNHLASSTAEILDSKTKNSPHRFYRARTLP